MIVQLVVGLALALGLGAKYTPQMAFGIIATGLVVAIVPVYMVANLACIGYFSKHRKEDRHPVIHILVPILGFLFLIPGFFNAAGITGMPGLKFIVSLASPLTWCLCNGNMDGSRSDCTRLSFFKEAPSNQRGSNYSRLKIYRGKPVHIRVGGFFFISLSYKP